MGHTDRNQGLYIQKTLDGMSDERYRKRMDALRSGYEAMGTINLQFAESIQEHDLYQLEQYESILATERD